MSSSNATPEMRQITAAVGNKLAEPRIVTETTDDKGNKLPEGGKNAPQPNNEFKQKTYEIIIKSARAIFWMAGLPEEASKDLFVFTEIGLIIASVSKMISQKSTANNFKSKHLTKNSKITYNGLSYDVANSDALIIVEHFYNKAGVSANQQGFFGCFQPLLYLTLMFRDRFKSYRVAPTQKMKGKTGDKRTVTNLAYYGILPHHAILCDGMNLAPYLASSLCQSMGVGLIIYNLMQSSDNFKGRWKDALVKQIKHLPRYQEIVKYLSEHDSVSCRRVVEELMDILLIMLPRQTQRGSLPINMLEMYFTGKLATYPDVKYDQNIKDDKVNKIIVEAEKIIVNADKVKKYNNSGLTFATAYNSICSHYWTIPGNIPESHVKTLVVLSIFGCGKEDFGVLQEMFATDFLKRSQIANSLHKQAHANSAAQVQPPMVRKFARMAQANVGGINLGSSSQQISSVVVFSGKRKRHFSGALIDQIRRRNTLTTSSTTMEGVLGLLHEIRQGILSRLETNEDVIGGTTEWYDYNPSGNSDDAMDTGETTFWTKSTWIPQESGVYYYG